MSIESINATSQVVNVSKAESKKEEEVKAKQQSYGSTKDILATLGVLASIGIAAVAIIKSKNAKKELQEALKKAEEEKKKLAEEAKKAAEEAKKAAEDINKKVDEAVDKAKGELKGSIKAPKTGGGRRSTGGGRRGYVSARTAEPTPTPHTAGPAPAPHAVEPIPAPHTPEPAPVPHAVEPIPAPHTPEPAPVPHAVEPIPAPHTPEPAPVPHAVEPTPTPHTVEPVSAPHAAEPAPTVAEPITEPIPVAETETTIVLRKPYTKPESTVVEIKPKKSEEVLKHEEQISNAELDCRNTDMAEVARNIIDEKPTLQPIDVLCNINLSKPLNRMSEKELLFEYNALKDAVKKLSVTAPAAKRFLEIQGELVNKRAFRVTKDGIVKREGVMDEYTKEGLEIIEKQEAEAQRTIAESDVRNAKWLEEQNAKREAEYEQMYLNAEKERIEESVKYLDEQEAAAKRAIAESDARNAQWVEAQRAQNEAEYEKMYLNAERERALAEGAKEIEGGNLDLLLDEVYPGYTRQLKESQNGIIVIPRATKLSNAVQRATDFVSEKLGKLKGLFGKKRPVEPEPKPFEPSEEGVAAWVEQLKNKHIEEGKQIKEQVAKDLKDNSNTTPIQEFIDSSVPRKHNKRYHDKLQKEYDKMAEEVNIQEAEVVKPEVVEAPKTEEVKPRVIRQPKVETQEPAVEIKEDVKVETPTLETPKAETPAQEVVKAETPKVEPKAETKPEIVETPKVEPKAAEKPLAQAAKAEIRENGLNEVDSLLVEREALIKSSDFFNKKRIAEINARLEELGAKDLKPNLEDKVAQANYNIEYRRAEQAYWQNAAKKDEVSLQEALKTLQEKNIKPLDIPMEEKELISEYLEKMRTYNYWKKEDPEYAQNALSRANQIKQIFQNKGKAFAEPTTEELKLQYSLIQYEVTVARDKKWVSQNSNALEENIKFLEELLQGPKEA